MNAHARRIAGPALAAVLAVAPLAAPAAMSSASASGYHAYRIEFLDARAHGSPGGVRFGRLQLRYEPNGLIDGFYRRGAGGPLVKLGGSVDGHDVNLRFANVAIDGTLDEGNIVGMGRVGDAAVTFQAVAQSDAPLPGRLAKTQRLLR